MKQTLGRQVVSTLLVKHILLLQHLHKPPSPVFIRPHQSWSRVCGRPPGAGAGLRAGAGPCTLGYTNVVAVALAKTAATVRKCAFSPNCWGTGEGCGVGWKWAPIGGLQYQTHMQAPTYDVQFLRSEALRSSSSSSSSSRTRQIKECKITSCRRAATTICPRPFPPSVGAKVPSAADYTAM